MSHHHVHQSSNTQHTFEEREFPLLEVLVDEYPELSQMLEQMVEQRENLDREIEGLRRIARRQLPQRKAAAAAMIWREGRRWLLMNAGGDRRAAFEFVLQMIEARYILCPICWQADCSYSDVVFAILDGGTY